MAESSDSIDIDAKVQMYGILSKKPFGHKSQRWQKRYARTFALSWFYARSSEPLWLLIMVGYFRFFIVKEGFLMYYSDNEEKQFDRSHHFNIHPKVCIVQHRSAVVFTFIIA